MRKEDVVLSREARDQQLFRDVVHPAPPSWQAKNASADIMGEVPLAEQIIGFYGVPASCCLTSCGIRPSTISQATLIVRGKIEKYTHGVHSVIRSPVAERVGNARPQITEQFLPVRDPQWLESPAQGGAVPITHYRDSSRIAWAFVQSRTRRLHDSLTHGIRPAPDTRPDRLRQPHTCLRGEREIVVKRGTRRKTVGTHTSPSRKAGHTNRKPAWWTSATSSDHATGLRHWKPCA